MAQDKVAYRGGNAGELFAEDDPLAELARIVGFDQPPSRAPSVPGPVEPPAEPVAGERPPHPVFSLEDELLREFERYDAPHLDPVDEIPVAEAAGAPWPETAYEPDAAGQVEPEVVQPEPVESAELVEPELVEDASFAADIPEAEDVRFSAPEEDFAPAGLFDDADIFPDAEPAADLPVATVPEAVADAYDWTALAVEPADAAVAGEAFEGQEFTGYDGAVDAGLADELELAIAGDEGDSAPEITPEPPRASGLRLPLANFRQVHRDEPSFDVAEAAAEEVPAPVEPEPSAPEAAGEAEDFLRFSPQEEPVYNVTHYATRPSGEPEVEAPQAFAEKADDTDLDIVPARSDTPPASAARQEPSLPEFAAGPADDEFELALDGLELDLSDIVLDEVEAAVPEADAAVAAPQPQPVAAPQPVAEPPPASAWEPPVEANLDDDGNMPFDASLIAEADYAPETIAEVDVPALPVHEPEQPADYRAAYDIDFETDIADLLAGEQAAAAATATAEAPQAGKPASAEADEFDFLLEEDFRNSLNAPLGAERAPGRMVIDPDDMQADPETRNRMRSWMLAGVASLAVLFAAGGLYAWFSSGGPGSARSGDGPPIIAADSEPVKVVPENPGGRVVPNQDKAVYDRVAGGASQTPTQPSLITSSEEPLDVVQRTLTPENLPLEGAEDDDFGASLAGDTEDPRLLPGGGTETAAAQGAEETANVSLRRVRTMIVRPDGTLVAREVPEETAPQPQAQTAAPLPAAASETATADDALRPAAGAPAPGASDEALSQAAASAVNGQVPVRTVNTAPVSDTAGSDSAPVPVQRPADQPVNVVGTVTDQGSVRPAENAPPAATPEQSAPQQQVASLPPGSYVVQIASLPSQADAERTYNNMSARYSNIIGGRGVDIRAAEIAGRGTFYRVRIPAGSKAEADDMCNRLKQAGGSCLVTR